MLITRFSCVRKSAFLLQNLKIAYYYKLNKQKWLSNQWKPLLIKFLLLIVLLKHIHHFLLKHLMVQALQLA